ncbi:hypothetical protein [Acinetobacter bereziniae]|uniref:hypothetical protein n=1 Tax=Acinetobacter bereziniae TaxID=106648 RepID=UPI00125046B4|nr:hypothetical protein [Acinetobacter bereziniae]
MKIVEIIKVLFCMSVLIILNACTTGLRQDNLDKYSFNNKMIEILGPDVKIINSINKSQTQISNVELSKDSKKLNEVITLLKQDGWVLKGQGKGVDTYCLGRNNRINIVTANSAPVIDYQGSMLTPGNFSINIIAFMYLISEVDSCK